MLKNSSGTVCSRGFTAVTTMLVTLIAVICILAAPAGNHANAQDKLQDGDSVDIKLLLKPGELKEITAGDPKAPNTIVEYSSLTCGHCAHLHEAILPEIEKKYIKTGKVYYIWRAYPLNNLDIAAFMLARCKEDKYREITSDLFAHQDEWAFVDNPLQKLKERVMKTAGYTDESFNACLGDQVLIDKIVKIRDLANDKFDVHSTPTLFVNGRILRGPSRIEQIEAMMTTEDTKK